MTPRITLYGKPGCHLCDDARQVVAGVRAQRAFELEEIDITVDPRLEARYGERIPVVAVNGEEAFEHHVDAAGLEERLDRVSP
jgi:glutaredoxin